MQKFKFYTLKRNQTTGKPMPVLVSGYKFILSQIRRQDGKEQEQYYFCIYKDDDGFWWAIDYKTGMAFTLPTLTKKEAQNKADEILNNNFNNLLYLRSKCRTVNY